LNLKGKSHRRQGCTNTPPESNRPHRGLIHNPFAG
jgi:hypothetical protein